MSKMQNLISGFLLLAASATFHCTEVLAQAQPSCEGPNAASNLPDTCQKEFISASGNQRPSTWWAMRSAEDHWKDQVLTKFGERYALWSKAACARSECVPSSLAGFTRCTLSGFPCSEKPAGGEPLLTHQEIREMQQLLNQGGYGLKVDGVFGPQSTAALESWQRRQNMTIDGVPTRENLRNLREWASAGASGSGEGEVLDAAGIREMQNFLNRYGYGIEIDGSFGPKTARALRRWQRSQDLKVDGLPNRLNLERLRRS